MWFKGHVINSKDFSGYTFKYFQSVVTNGYNLLSYLVPPFMDDVFLLSKTVIFINNKIDNNLSIFLKKEVRKK